MYIFVVRICMHVNTHAHGHIHGHVKRERPALIACFLVPHRLLYLYNNALVTLPSGVFDALGNLRYVCPSPKRARVWLPSVLHACMYLLLLWLCMCVYAPSPRFLICTVGYIVCRNVSRCVL